MRLWKVTVVARHRFRYAKSHSTEDCLVSYLFTRTKREAARWAALETLTILSRYDRGGDFYWDDYRRVEETEEVRILRSRRRRKWPGWPAEYDPFFKTWRVRRTGQWVNQKEAHRRNRISLTRRKRRKAREAAEAGVPEAPQLNLFYREFSPYPTWDALAPAEPTAYEETEADEETIERLHSEYDELEAEGSPSGA